MSVERVSQYPPAPSSRVAGLEPIVHGGASWADLERQGIDPYDVIDLSTNVSPYGPPPAVFDILSRVKLDRYPDAQATRMREAIACRLHLTSDQVIAGNGSIELIYLLAQIYLDPGDRTLILGPTFGEYATASRFAGAEVVEHRARRQDSFRFDIAGILASIRVIRPKLVFCCNPNNPSGQMLDEAAVCALVDAVRSVGGLLVLDEAYLGLVDEGACSWDSLDLLQRGPVVLLRSLTKDYAVPGLRLAYALAPAEIARTVNSLRLPWAVNAIAEEVGCALLDEVVHIRRCRERLARDKRYLLETLIRLGADYVPSVVNYCLIQAGDYDGAAADCRCALLPHGVNVRDCTSFGLPEYIRVSVHSREATDRLARGLSEWQEICPQENAM
jgi:histidinol-phosphate aminotransferase